jgi:hypothetical protein
MGILQGFSRDPFYLKAHNARKPSLFRAPRLGTPPARTGSKGWAAIEAHTAAASQDPRGAVDGRAGAKISRIFPVHRATTGSAPDPPATEVAAAPLMSKS